MKVLVLLLFLVLLASNVQADDDIALITGKVTLEDHVTPVEGASVDVECNSIVKNYPSTLSDGTYAVVYTEEDCDDESLVTVTATKDSMAGTNTGIVQNDDNFESLDILDINIAVINVAIPEFTTVTALVALLGVTAFMVYRRRQE